jgi:hypothetical protein
MMKDDLRDSRADGRHLMNLSTFIFVYRQRGNPLPYYLALSRYEILYIGHCLGGHCGPLRKVRLS